MFSFFVFILAGVAIAALTLAKRFEMKGKKLSLLKAVSLGDARARDLYHKGLHFYSDGKHKALFFLQKQLPTKAKIYTNRALTKVKGMTEERFGNIRNSRLINRKEGISEFFKNISEAEKGGELHDDVYVEKVEEKEEILAYRITPAATVELESISVGDTSSAKPKKPRAPRKPRVKKIPVVEVVEY